MRQSVFRCGVRLNWSEWKVTCAKVSIIRVSRLYVGMALMQVSLYTCSMYG